MAPKRRKVNDEDKKLYCICRQMYDDQMFMIKCDLCGNWFHGAHVGVPNNGAPEGDWFCDQCMALNHTCEHILKAVDDLLKAKLEDQAQSLRAENHKLIATLKQEFLDKLAAKDSLQVQVKSLIKEKTELFKENAALKIDLSSKIAECNNLSEAKKKIDDLNTKLSQLNNVSDSLQEQVKSLSKEKIELIKENAALRTDVSANIADCKNLSEAKKVIDDLKAQLSKLNNDKHNWAEAFNLFEKDMNGKLTDANNVIDNLNAKNAELQAQLNKTNNKRKLSLSQQKTKKSMENHDGM